MGSIDLLLYSPVDIRLSAPLINPVSILERISSSPFASVQVTSVINCSRRQSSSSGTHSKTDPRAIQKKFFRSFTCHRPLPSAMFKEIDNDARRN